MKRTVVLDLSDVEEAVLADAVARGVNDAQTPEALLLIGAQQKLSQLAIDFAVLRDRKHATDLKRMPVKSADALAEIAALVAEDTPKSKAEAKAKLDALKAEIK